MNWLNSLMAIVVFFCQACSKAGSNKINNKVSSENTSNIIELVRGGWKRGDEQLMFVGSQLQNETNQPVKTKVEIYFQKENKCYQEVFITDLLELDGSDAPPKLKSYGGPLPFVMAMKDVTNEMINCPKFENINDVPDEIIEKMKLNTFPGNAGVGGTEIYNLPPNSTEEQLIFAHGFFDQFVFNPEGFSVQPVLNVLTGKITGIVLPHFLLVAKINPLTTPIKIGTVDLAVRRRKVIFQNIPENMSKGVGISHCLMFKKTFYSALINVDDYEFFLETIKAFKNNDYSYFNQFKETKGCI